MKGIPLKAKLIIAIMAIPALYLMLNLAISVYFILHPLPVQKNFIPAFALLSIVLIAIALALSLWFSRRIIRVLKSLIQQAGKIATGEVSKGIEIISREDELGEIAEGLLRIASYIQSLQSRFSEKFINMHEDLQKTLDELSRQEQELLHSAKLASMGKLAACVAHEINNPLTGIRTLAKILLEKCDENDTLKEQLDDFKKYLFLIETEATRCGTIVKNLLAFARQDKMKMEPVNLNQVIDRCLSLMEYNFKVQKISLTKELKEGIPSITGDFFQIQQSLMAILINATEAMSRGGNLTVQTGANDSFVWIKITDTGAGISQENLKHIFEPFFTTKEKGKGLGLGLSVAYGIIENHRGKIEVQSELGKGTTFQILFPVHRKEGKN